MTEPPGGWLSECQQRAWRSFLEADRLLLTGLERQLQADTGMSLTDYEILVRLAEVPERTIRMSELADQALLSRSRLSHAVRRLEQLGWVTRGDCPTDRRGTFAILTDDGLAALERAAPAHVATVRRYVFDALTPDQVQQLQQIGDAIRSRVEPHLS